MSERVNDLRIWAKWARVVAGADELAKDLDRAADTIELVKDLRDALGDVISLDVDADGEADSRRDAIYEFAMGTIVKADRALLDE